MAINFDRVKDVHLAEKSTSGLSKVEPDFYDQLREFIESERDRLREKMENSGIGLDPTDLYTYRNLITLVKEIIALRTEKIIRSAITDAFADAEPLLENTTPWEESLYWEVRKRIEKMMNRVVGEKRETSFNLVHVRILTDIPLFVGPDFKEYGPFRAGEEVPLPREVANMLAEKGQAEVIK